MFDEPYRWIDAIHQRRDYISEQLDRASPVLGISLPEGIFLATFHRQNPKIFEIYDRIALAGIGHPADLETVRGLLLNMAHVEGFQRSPRDVSIERLALFGLAPKLKSAFEDISVPPIILDVLLAEMGDRQENDRFVQVAFDGNLKRSGGFSVLAPTSDVSERMERAIRSWLSETTASPMVDVPGRVRDLFLRIFHTNEELGLDDDGVIKDPLKMEDCAKRLQAERTWEAILMDRSDPTRIRRVPIPEPAGAMGRLG